MNWRRDFARAGASGLGTVLALWVTSWPGNAAEGAWAGLGGALVGLALCLAAEHVVGLSRELRRLNGLECQLEVERAQMAQERKLRQRQIEVAQREAAVSAVWTEVWGGAFNEAIGTGHILPLSAVLARAEVMLKAKNLDKPLPPLGAGPIGS